MLPYHDKFRKNSRILNYQFFSSAQMTAALEAIIYRKRIQIVILGNFLLMSALSSYCLICTTVSLVGHHSDYGVATVHPVPGPSDGAPLYLTDGTWSSRCLSVSVPLPAQLGYCVSRTISHLCSSPSNQIVVFREYVSVIFLAAAPIFRNINKVAA